MTHTMILATMERQPEAGIWPTIGVILLVVFLLSWFRKGH